MSKEAVAGVELGGGRARGVREPERGGVGPPSGCAGWRVQDVAAHMSSNFKETSDPSPPPEPPLPPMPAERLMDMLVQPRLAWTSEQVLDELRVRARGPSRP